MRADVDYRSALANHEPWTCARCGAQYDGGELPGQWVDTKVEPTATCDSCGAQALLGDWPGEFPAVLVGAPIVEFHNWHPLRRDFARELTRMLGGHRCRYFWSRF